MRRRRLSASGTCFAAKKDLVIATATLPGDASAPASQNQAGLELIKAIQAQASPPPCILVSDRPSIGD